MYEYAQPKKYNSIYIKALISKKITFLRITNSYCYLKKVFAILILLKYLALPDISNKSAILGKRKASNPEFALNGEKMIIILN